MSTTEQSHIAEVTAATAASLLEFKQRRRVQHLLYTRDRLMLLSAEQRAHGLDEAVELYSLQLEVEQTIADEFPDVFAAAVGQWAEDEAAAEHHPLVTSAACTLCKAIAAQRRKDQELPRAA